MFAAGTSRPGASGPRGLSLAAHLQSWRRAPLRRAVAGARAAMRSAFVRSMGGWPCRVLTAAVLLFPGCLAAQAQMRGPAGSGSGSPYGGGGYGGGGYRGGPMIGLPGMIGVIPRMIPPPRQRVEEVEDEEPLPRRPVRQPDYEDEPPPYRPRPRPRPQAPPPVHRAEPVPTPRPRQAAPAREPPPKVVQRPERSKPIAAPAASTTGS